MKTSTRPGGRSARVRAAVMAATLDELARTGYADLTVEKIADRAGVNKTTIYRRWSDLDGVLAELLAELGATVVIVPDTGSLDGDLRSLAALVQAALTDAPVAALLTGLAAAAPRSTRAAGVLHDFFTGRYRLAADIVDRAVTRGELPTGTDGYAVIEAVSAPFYHRLLLTREPIDELLASRAALAATAAARAGAFIAHA